MEPDMTTRNEEFRLTDELERRLMLQAIEEQFRPRPGRALRNFLTSLAASVRATAGLMSVARRQGSETQLM